MTDRIDHDGRMKTAEIPEAGEQDFIPRRFLRDGPENPELDILNMLNKNKEEYPIIELTNKIFPRESLFEKNIELNKIKPLMLEGKNVDRRLDRFIEEEMRMRGEEARIEIPQRADRSLLPKPDPKKRFRSSSGLYADISAFRKDSTVKGEKVTLADYAEIHFTPEGRGHFNPSKITDSLSKGIQGVIDLLDAIDQGEFQAAQVFVGTTNINMALIAQRLGFVIVDECRTPDGNINKDLRYFTIVGRLEDIRARVNEFKRVGVAQRLEQRNQRLRAKPKIEPVGA